MRRRLVSLLVVGLVGAAVPLEAEATQTRWSERFPGAATGIAMDPQGRVVVVGTRRERVGDRQERRLVVESFGVGGATRWVRAWGPGRRLAVLAPVVDTMPDGTVIVGGTLADGFCGAWFLRAYGADGSLRWHREQANAADCPAVDRVSSVSASSGAVVLTGNHVSDGIGAVDGWIRSFSPRGGLRWRRAFTAGLVPSRWWDGVQDVAVSGIGRIYVVGQASPERDDGIPRDRRIVRKYAADGSVIWSRVLGGPRTGLGFASSVSVVGPWLVVGGAITHRSRNETWVARFGFDGELLRQRVWGTAGTRSVDVAVTPSGEVVVARTALAGTVLMELGPSLATRWKRIFPEAPFDGSPVAVGGGGAATVSEPASGPGSLVHRVAA